MHVLVADDRAQVRWALRTFLQDRFGLTVVGEAADCDSLLSEAKSLQPDLVVVEWELPGRPGAQMLDALRRLQVPCRIVVLGPAECRAIALRGGADAFVWKAARPEQLAGALRDLGVEAESALRPAGTVSS